MATGSQRMALQEITTTTVDRPVSRNQDHILNVFIDLPLTPVSPDEEIIRQRGRYRNSAVARANTVAGTIDEVQLTPKKTNGKSPRKIKTPLKMTPSKTPVLPLRTSPRKRLNLPDALSFQCSSFVSPDESPSASRTRKFPAKRIKLQTHCTTITNVEGSLTALSHAQLVHLMKTVITKHPEIKDSVVEEIPSPDLSPLEEKLNSLQRNIYRSIPSTRWESNRDSFCYRRTNSHLEAFKKECVEQGRQLIQNQQWETALEYFFLAWRYVKTLPDWDNVAHNKAKLQCFKALASICLTSIKNGVSEEPEMVDTLHRLTLLNEDNDCLSPCVKHLEEKLQ